MRLFKITRAARLDGCHRHVIVVPLYARLGGGAKILGPGVDHVKAEVLHARPKRNVLRLRGLVFATLAKQVISRRNVRGVRVAGSSTWVSGRLTYHRVADGGAHSSHLWSIGLNAISKTLNNTLTSNKAFALML